MDTITHGVVAVLLVRAVTKKSPSPEISETEKGLIAAAAAMFPDSDYLSFWINPYLFITEWHRGITHSLVMLPFWAILLGSLISWIRFKRAYLKQCISLCVLGLVSHIVLDLCTVYGTQIFAPLSRYRAAFSLSFDIDPWFALAVGCALLASFYRRKWARCGILGLLFCMSGQAYLQSKAYRIGQEYAQLNGDDIEVIHTVPQPYSPWHWKLVVERSDHYEMAHLNLSAAGIMAPDWNAIFRRIGVFDGMAVYRRSDRLRWNDVPKPGALSQQMLVSEVWNRPEMAPFRKFARLPWVYRVDTDPDKTCVWLSDLRYSIPGLLEPFRYGMCRQAENSNWALYRLRRSAWTEKHKL